MKNADGVIMQGDGLLFFFNHQPICQFLAKAKIGCQPEEIWRRISQSDLVYCEQTNTPNPLENFNKGESLESFFEDVKRVLFIDKLDYEEFVHIWCNSIHIPSYRMHRIIPKIRVPVVAVVNTNHAHWENVRMYNYFMRNINCFALSFKSKMTMPSSTMLLSAHKKLEEKLHRKILNPVYLGSREEHLAVAAKLNIMTCHADDQNLPEQLEKLGII